MSWSLDAIAAFSTCRLAGSFSAAARRLGKSQSTISEAIANLEIDLGVSLFERSGASRYSLRRAAIAQPCPPVAGRGRCPQPGGRAAGGRLEPRLTIVLSDTFQSESLEQMLRLFEQQFPHWSWKRWWQKKKT
jgi:DNA-binding transcriptional LysR family regulator